MKKRRNNNDHWLTRQTNQTYDVDACSSLHQYFSNFNLTETECPRQGSASKLNKRIKKSNKNPRMKLVISTLNVQKFAVFVLVVWCEWTPTHSSDLWEVRTRTSSMSSTLAPLLSNIWTVLACPDNAANIKAVFPSWQQHTRNQYVLFSICKKRH